MTAVQLKNAILQYAVQGKLAIQDPNDEPAAVLLEKIRKEKQALVKAGKIKKEKVLPPVADEDVPFAIPKGWEWVRLGEITSIVMVIGKIANDNVGETVSFVMRGIMRKEDALERLKFERINNQVCFSTEKALLLLQYTGYEEL